MNKRLSIFLLFIVVLAFPLSASMVSFLVVETGLNENVPSSQISTLWGGGLMSAFFDEGYIVTDSPLVRMEKKPSNDFTGQVEEDYLEAVNAGSEYFILGFLEYRIVSEKVVPVNITIKLYDISGKKLIYENVFAVGEGKNLAEEQKYAMDAGKILISQIKDR